MEKATMIDFALDELSDLCRKIEIGAISCGYEFAEGRLPVLWEQLVFKPNKSDKYAIAECRRTLTDTLVDEFSWAVERDEWKSVLDLLSDIGVTGIEERNAENRFHVMCFKTFFNETYTAIEEYVKDWFEERYGPQEAKDADRFSYIRYHEELNN